ncbi:GDP-mannose 4,6-dehydratase, partial [bacterium]|nr:GDP-mannose 4,6-dehydratase [bacterium]
MESLVEYLDIFKGVYRGKRVLVTGHTGFKGSWLSLWLVALGAKVAGLSLYLPSNPCNFEVIGLCDKITHYDGDIRDARGLQKVFDEFNPEIVFHLAAQPIVRRSYD